MASLEGYHRESSYDRFKDHIGRNIEKGHEAHGSTAGFASLHCLTQYWTAAKVQEVVADTGDVDYQIEDIRKQYLHILSILVWSSTTGRSYVRYLKHFVRKGADDHILPFRERPAFLPSTTDSEIFWTTFFKNQWMFCPVQLRGMYNRELHPNQILPFTIYGDLDSQNIGRPAKIRLAKVHCSETLAPILSTGGNIVLKSYDSPHEKSYQNEIKAYHALSNAKSCDNILKYIGSYCVQPLAPGSGLQYTILLEHAERGSLLQLYGENDPPITPAETKAFWSSLLQVAKGLMVAHNAMPRRAGASCVHQDLKPSNIFVFGRGYVSAAEFDLTLKIGDFGNSHTRMSGPYDSGTLGYDSGSTRTYCPPELYWNHEVDFIVGPLQDMWSLGCVLIEAAVWVSFGRRGRTEFQRRRRHENDEVAPLQRDLGRSDCFHNGKTRLKTVEEVFDLVQKDGRRSDELTPKVVRLVLDHLLVDENSRFEARILSTELEKIIRTTTDVPDDRSSHRISTASSATRSHRSQDYRHSQHNGTYEPQSASPRSQYEPPTPSTTINSMSQNHTPYIEGVSLMRVLSNRGSSVRSQMNPAEPWNHNDGIQGLHRMDSGQRPMTLLSLNGMHGMHSDHYTTSPTYGGFDSGEYRRSPSGTVGQGLVQRYSEHTQSPDQPLPAQRTPTTVTNRSNSTVVHSQLADYKRATFPDLTMESVHERRAESKSSKSRRLLPGEDQAMIFLKRRDHILVVDNSKHMREFKSQVLDVFANLAHILEAADPNGLDVMCTFDPENMQNSKATDKLVRFVQSNFDKGGTSPCFIETALKTLVDKVIDKLPSGPGERKKLMARIKNDRVRPVSIYVLTSGVWDSSEAAREGTCGAERPINQLITELQRRNLHKSQVAIQFIRFGNYQTGIDRLTYLDDCLGKPHYDIVDHKSSNGSVWPMLIGSLDEGNDRENDA